MEKKIMGFRRLKGECCPGLVVKASRMLPEEFEIVKKELDSFGFRYERIEPESILAYLSFDTFGDEYILGTINKLKESGWEQ